MNEARMFYLNKLPIQFRKKKKDIVLKSTTVKRTQIDIFFDGACRNLPKLNQPMGVGVAVFLDKKLSYKNSIALHYIVQEPLRGTSNMAEWRGCVSAMKIAATLFEHYEGNCNITIYSDSQLIARQFNGLYLIKNPDFELYNNLAHDYAKLSGITDICWVRREYNKAADILSKIGLKKLDDHEFYEKGLPQDCQHILEGT